MNKSTGSFSDWERMSRRAKIWWWIQLFIFLALALPVSVIKGVFSRQEREEWAGVYRRVWVSVDNRLVQPLRSLLRKKPGVSEDDSLTLVWPDIDLHWEYSNLVGNSLMALVIVLILYIVIASFTFAHMVRLAPLTSSGLPAPKVEGGVVKTALDQYREDLSFSSNKSQRGIVLILDRGQEEYSPYTYTFEPKYPWERTPTILYFTSLSLDQGLVDFEDARHFEHRVDFLRPMVFYQQQQYTYLVEPSGAMWLAQVALLPKVKVANTK